MMDIMSDEPCFHCGAPPTIRYEATIPQYDDPTLVERMLHHGRERGRVLLVIHACGAHEPGLADALTDHFGSASGQRLGPLPDENCPDPFHSNTSDGETVETSHGDGLWSQHFRCPTCGFETMRFKGHVMTGDPAFIRAARLLDSIDVSPAPPAPPPE